MDRRFEDQWIRSNSGYQRINSHCFALNIANIDRLRSTQYIADDPEAATSRFSIVAMDILEMLPHDRAGFVSALQDGILANMPVQKLSTHGRAEKLEQLKAWLLH